MSFIRKSLLFTLIIILLLSEVSCREIIGDRPELDINSPETVYDDLVESSGEWTLDPTGTFSYKSIIARGNIRPFFEQDYEYPYNMFIYETNTSSTGDIKMYGYMDTEFKNLS